MIEGEAGIGKTTLWLEGVRIAEQREFRVLQAQPAESEALLSYAALTDLVGDAFGKTRGLLPPPQETALAAAVLQADADDTIDARTTATAVLGVLTALVAQERVLVAIDDVQWLDPASERALTFALRRAPAGIGILLARRSGSDEALVKELEHGFRQGRLEQVDVGPLSLAGLHHLLALHLGHAPARPTLSMIAAASGGNPFFALELARALAAEGDDRALADPMPLPRSLQALVASRLDRLSPTARHVLAAAAAASRPTAATLVDALEPEVDAHAGLAEAEEANVIASARGRIRFSHPLVASAVYASLTASRRRTLHRRLADVVDDREERARHLARSATDADDVIAGELEEVGVEAAARGAQDAAAELLEHARRLTPEGRPVQLGRRTLAQATALVAVGDHGGARVLAEQAIALADDAPSRAAALSLAALLDQLDGDAIGALERLEEALAAPQLEPELRGRLTAMLARFGVLEDPRRAEADAAAAAGLLSEEAAPGLVAGALIDRFFAAAMLGRGADAALLRRALELERRGQPAEQHPIPLVWFHFTDAFEDARARYAEDDAVARERGWESTRLDRLAHLAMVELYAGRWDLAERDAEESCEMATLADARGATAMRFAFRSLVDAHRGRTDRARPTVLALIEKFEREGQTWWQAMSLSALAFVEFADERHEAADEAVTRMWEIVETRGIVEAPLDRSERFHVEALCALGQIDRAHDVLARLEWRHRTLPRPWTAVALPRARADVLAADGDLAAALAALDELELDVAHRLPFELAWSQLVRGRLLRRTRQKRAAAETLREALEVFERLGAPAWAARARQELARVGLRHRSPHELTESERRVGELAANGLTNREIAAAAFLSPKTVEANLGRVYRKLGIRSRAELGARMTRAGEGAPPEK